MDFENMKVIWDTQNEESMFAINKSALHERIKKKASGFKRLVLFFEGAIIVVALGLSIFYVMDPLLTGQQYDRLISAAILLGAAAYFYVGVWRRQRREAEFDASLRGDLNKALWQVEYHIARSRAIRWSFIVPLCLAATIDFVFPLGKEPIGFFLLFLLVMVGAAWGVEYEIRHWYLPKKRRLESLRERLMEVGH